MTKLTPKEFVNAYLPFAKQTQNKTGINACFILAQAALETGWGSSVVGNMFFGIKANPTITPEEKRQLLTTREVLSKPDAKFPQVISVKPIGGGKYEYRVKDWFRKYDTPEGSFSDHAQFFFDNKRYSKALEVKHDPIVFADEIAKAGYATDPNYAKILKSIITMLDKYID